MKTVDEKKWAVHKPTGRAMLLSLIAAFGLCAPGIQSLRADTIDDAEAKRRGVSVEQIHLEDQLAKEITKVQQLEKQVADLKAQVAILNAQLAGHGATTTTAPALSVSFFSIKTSAKRVVFIIDHSGSMLDNYDFVRKEAVLAVGGLEKEQSFGVVLVSDKATTVGKDMQFATDEAKNRFAKDIAATKAEGANDNLLEPFKQAFEKAFAMGPQAIFFLSDGKFGNELLPAVKRLNAERGVRIYTLAFVSEEPAYKKQLETLAQENGGSYHFVSEKDLAK